MVHNPNPKPDNLVSTIGKTTRRKGNKVNAAIIQQQECHILSDGH